MRSAGVCGGDLGALSQAPDRIWAALIEAQPRMDGTDAVRYVFLSVAEKKTRRIGLVWSACRVLVPH